MENRGWWEAQQACVFTILYPPSSILGFSLPSVVSVALRVLRG
jgi:hypothetical protein